MVNHSASKCFILVRPQHALSEPIDRLDRGKACPPNRLWNPPGRLAMILACSLRVASSVKDCRSATGDLWRAGSWSWQLRAAAWAATSSTTMNHYGHLWTIIGLYINTYKHYQHLSTMNWELFVLLELVPSLVPALGCHRPFTSWGLASKRWNGAALKQQVDDWDKSSRIMLDSSSQLDYCCEWPFSETYCSCNNWLSPYEHANILGVLACRGRNQSFLQHMQITPKVFLHNYNSTSIVTLVL